MFKLKHNNPSRLSLLYPLQNQDVPTPECNKFVAHFKKLFQNGQCRMVPPMGDSGIEQQYNHPQKYVES